MSHLARDPMHSMGIESKANGAPRRPGMPCVRTMAARGGNAGGGTLCQRRMFTEISHAH